MYFEIENTPEHIKRARRAQVPQKTSPKEECPRLILAPFSRPPQVVFDGVPLGSCCEREFEVYNPTEQVQQITLGKALPPGLIIHLPGEWLVVEPETHYCLVMQWTPTQPTALRETIRFTNENRGRYDVVVVLKSAMKIKGKTKQPKVFKISPGKVRKKTEKKSPVAIYKKKAEFIATKVKKTVVESIHYNVMKSMNVLKPSTRDNIPNFDYTIESQTAKCPFDSPTSLDFNFDTTEIFSNMRKTATENILQNTYDKPTTSQMARPITEKYILKSSNKENYDISPSELFDNLTFTPMKPANAKIENLEKEPQIILSMNSDSELDDSLNVKENDGHSIICITSSKSHNQWMNKNHQNEQLENQLKYETIPNKKIPNTSSPKEWNSPNFTMNTEISRISDLSFFPPRFSTERKVIPKIALLTDNNETHELLDPNGRLNSDTYTKDSPNTPLDFQINNVHADKPPHFFMREQPKMCRQALFRESQQFREIFDKYYLNSDVNVWNKDLKGDKSPRRSITPPLQSIPEESQTTLGDTQVLDKTNKQVTTFSMPMNRTFDKLSDRYPISTTGRQTWSKMTKRTEPELWKMPAEPVRKPLKPKASVGGKESLSGKMSINMDKSIGQNISLNVVGNVYSQSATVDPFLSDSYFYDEEAVHKLESEFKRWLNYILTPPADLDSNIEQTMDVGKAWIENRNKEVPAAPTKEQVCSKYHNNHRLESLRRSARALLMSPEIAQVIHKLNLQIEKKLIAVRNDRNLHLDVGLQKVILELLLSYNPLWLRVGLEAIYDLVLPLKSNSDIEGLTTFIIQRMFKNPFLKNKHSKSSVPNMLLPAYMEAIKKFTLKKFFMLVFFLDQAKQKKLISHDPCLFCRNAVCKESREIIIRFTRELIAGIGDITKHLRPIGYVVCVKQSYLDEYKYAVHNIALDIRDGVRLTKVMEIILMKNGLLNQLRTPAISRLQKIHNVQVALNALKEANFVIDGDISPQDIADGHREKTLSLLWQLIHVFRAPLFEKAAVIIQTWWRKKYEVILEKRRKEELLLQKLNNAASIIQYWWRRIQYNRLAELQMRQLISATVVIQKFCRKWLCRTQFLTIKKSVLTIEKWYRSIRLIREAKITLEKLKLKREELFERSATVLQTYIRRWLCMKEYQKTIRKVTLIQSTVRGFIMKRRYQKLRRSAICVQQLYRGKLQMKKERKAFIQKKNAAITIQSCFRMRRARRLFLTLKKSVKTIEDKYLALVHMRKEAKQYQRKKKCVILIQTLYRGFRSRKEFTRNRNLIILLQRKIRAHLLKKQQREIFLKLKSATIVIQRYVRSFQAMKKAKQDYIVKRDSAILIQRRFRAQRCMKAQRTSYIRLRNAAVILQKHYRALLAMREQRRLFLKHKHGAIVFQRRYRAQIRMRHDRECYQKLRNATLNVQRRVRAIMQMREERGRYLKLRSSCVTIQTAFRAHVLRNQHRQAFLKQKSAAIAIQNWFRSCKKRKEVQQEYVQTKQACVTIQRVYRAYIIGRNQRQEYIKIKTATIRIQKYYRSYIEMKTVRQQFIQLKIATVTIQKFYRLYLDMRVQRKKYLRMRSATLLIQDCYRRYLETKRIQNEYCKLRKTVVFIQQFYRNICAMKKQRRRYLLLKQSAVTVQQRYRAILEMRVQRQSYLKMRSSAIIIQNRFRALKLMKKARTRYQTVLKSCNTVQRAYRAYVAGKRQREQYLLIRKSAIVLQQRYRALLAMRRERSSYQSTRIAIITIQRKFRAQILMSKQQSNFKSIRISTIIIQRAYRAYVAGKKQRKEFIKIKTSAITIQSWYRSVIKTRTIRTNYMMLRNAVVFTQRQFRAKLLAKKLRRQKALVTIQTWFRSLQKRDQCRKDFLKIKTSTILLQSTARMFIQRKRLLAMKKAATTIQKFYRSYKLTLIQRQNYIQMRTAIIEVQSFVRTFIERKRYLRIRSAILTIQAAYRLKKQRRIMKLRRESAAICIQKNFKRYLARSKYLHYRNKVIYLQKLWRGKLVTRMVKCEFQQKRNFIILLQARIRGFLTRRYCNSKKEEIQKIREEQIRHRAATVIQAHWRGHRMRVAMINNRRVTELRRRWREGALKSTQETFRERNKDATYALYNASDIETVIRAFRSLELLTEVLPMMYEENASSIVGRVYIFMSVTNRSISSIELLKSAAALLVNLTRYRVTGPKIYSRDRIEPILKFMCRFSNNEIELFCILCTYLWLFSKYDHVKEDLTEYFAIPENTKLLTTIKGNIERMRRMARNKFQTPQQTRRPSMNYRLCSNSVKNGSIPLPALEPDYGITRADNPKYFEDAHQAITCLFNTYNL